MLVSGKWWAKCFWHVIRPCTCSCTHSIANVFPTVCADSVGFSQKELHPSLLVGRAIEGVRVGACLLATCVGVVLRGRTAFSADLMLEIVLGRMGEFFSRKCEYVFVCVFSTYIVCICWSVY